MNVLITSASRKVSLILTFKKAVIKSGGKVVAIDINRLSPALYFADACEIAPRNESPEFIPFVRALCKRYNISLIVPTRDEDLSLFSKHKTEFKRSGVQVMVSDPESIEICQDKEQFHNFCIRNNFGVPKRYTISENDIQFPAFVKPKIGKGGKNTFKVMDYTQLGNILNQLSQKTYLIEEFIDWPEFSVDLFADFGGEIISVIPRRRDLVIAGESYISTTIKNEKIIQESIKIAKKLKLIGHITLQLFKNDSDEIKFIEINPRFGGASHLGFEAGAPTPEFLIRLMEGQPVSPIIGQYKENLVMLRFTEDIFLDEKGKHIT